ncbi:MAG: 30S ribosomal protein S27ae [Nitrososphaerota archaeon]|nr:30S ribosomal protein S27ae [Aigarchaeota archaeon]MDW8076044.1 30S ribosomal protein S27ae [Nitrososphaerota archaeon]
MGKQAKLWAKYKLDGDNLTRDTLFCPRCGKGYVMANHADRYTCGNCHYTEFKRKDETKKT